MLFRSITILDLPLPRATTATSLDFRLADWPAVNSALASRLETDSPAVLIKLRDKFLTKVDTLVTVIKEVLGDHLEVRCPSPFKCRWWTMELTNLKKAQNCLSGKSFRLRHVQDHPIHAEHKASVKEFKDAMAET